MIGDLPVLFPYDRIYPGELQMFECLVDSHLS
jgi:hypothetical protein